VLPDRAAVGESEILDVGAPGVGRLHEAEEPRARAAAGGHEGLDRVAAEVRVDRERVDEGLGAVGLLDICVRIGAGGRPDVAPLPVGHDEEAGGARVGARLLEGAKAVRPEGFKESELELHAYDVRSDGVDESAAEAGAGVRSGRAARVSFAAKLDREEVGAGIEPDEQLAPLPLDRVSEPIGEDRDCRLQADSDSLRHALSLQAESADFLGDQWIGGGSEGESGASIPSGSGGDSGFRMPPSRPGSGAGGPPGTPGSCGRSSSSGVSGSHGCSAISKHIPVLDVSEAEHRQLGRRSAQEGADEEQLVGVLRSKRGSGRPCLCNSCLKLELCTRPSRQ
jgi:hypothetical protein